MKILELQGFSDFRIPASDPDFRSFPGNFDRNLSESDVQLCVKDVERMAIDSDNLLANCVRDPTSSLTRNLSCLQANVPTIVETPEPSKRTERSIQLF